VLISFKPLPEGAGEQEKEENEQQRKEVFDRYQTIAKECGGAEAGILFWHVGRSLDERKNIHLVEVSIFRDNDALQAFRVHPKHKELTDILQNIADWWVGDTMAPWP
jgi:quinol monooxygenase YgiN